MDEKEYLTFSLLNEEYGVDILCVQEIRVFSKVTELPNKPEYIKGVINLRGVIVPIIDLRLRFGLKPLTYGKQTVTIILRNSDKTMTLGVIVDAVSDVYRLNDNKINPAPSFGHSIDSSFLKGLADVDEKLIILLNMDVLLDEEEFYRVDNCI